MSRSVCRWAVRVAAAWVAVLVLGFAALPARAADLAEELKAYPYKIVFETYRDGNWELYQIDADGSRPVNLTRTPQFHEMYPHVSPDGAKISFLADEGEGEAKVRNVYVMNYDGTGRTLVARNGRDPCWNADGSALVYLPGEFEKWTIRDYASKGIATWRPGRPAEMHPNPKIEHLYNICCTRDGKWCIATVHAGMGEGHAILAIEARGMKVVNLKIPGCRPDLSPDGTKIAWGADDFTLCSADLDLSGPEPKLANRRDIIKSEKPLEAYHVDWSPDGKYVTFSRGPKRKTLAGAPEMIGAQAKDWNLCVADASATNRFIQLTQDGQSNKEPDWVPVKMDAVKKDAQ